MEYTEEPLMVSFLADGVHSFKRSADARNLAPTKNYKITLPGDLACSDFGADARNPISVCHVGHAWSLSGASVLAADSVPPAEKVVGGSNIVATRAALFFSGKCGRGETEGHDAGDHLVHASARVGQLSGEKRESRRVMKGRV